MLMYNNQYTYVDVQYHTMLPIDIVYSVFDVFNLESGYILVEYG